MELIASEDKFLIGGKRIQIFNNDKMRSSLTSLNEEMTPLLVDFNPYFRTFNVLTKHDLRIYDAYTGKLRKVLTDLQDEHLAADVTTYQIGPRLRKFFVADNAGLCRLYNMKNGELIENVIELSDIKKNVQNNSKLKKKSNEITQLIYCEDQKILITVSCESVVRVYEAKDGEGFNLLRVLKYILLNGKRRAL